MVWYQHVCEHTYKQYILTYLSVQLTKSFVIGPVSAQRWLQLLQRHLEGNCASMSIKSCFATERLIFVSVWQ